MGQVLGGSFELEGREEGSGEGESTAGTSSSSSSEGELTKTTTTENKNPIVAEGRPSRPTKPARPKLDEKLCGELMGKITELLITTSLLRTYPERKFTPTKKNATFNLIITPVIEFCSNPELNEGPEDGKKRELRKAHNVQGPTAVYLSAVRMDNNMVQALKIEGLSFTVNNPKAVFNKALGRTGMERIKEDLVSMKENPEFCKRVDSDASFRVLANKVAEDDPYVIPLEFKLLSCSTTDFDVPLTVNISNVLFGWSEICEQREKKTKDLLVLAKELQLKLAKKKKCSGNLSGTPSAGYVSMGSESDEDEESEPENEASKSTSTITTTTEVPPPQKEVLKSNGKKSLSKLELNLAKIKRFSNYICEIGDFESDQRKRKAVSPRLTKKGGQRSAFGDSRLSLFEDRQIVFSIHDKFEGKSRFSPPPMESQIGYKTALDPEMFSLIRNPGGCPPSRLKLSSDKSLSMYYETIFDSKTLESDEFEVAKDSVELFFKSHEIHFYQDEMCKIVDKYNESSRENTRRSGLNANTTDLQQQQPKPANGTISFINVGVATETGLTFRHKNGNLVKYDLESHAVDKLSDFGFGISKNSKVVVTDGSSEKQSMKITIGESDAAEENVLKLNPLIAISSKSCQKIREGLDNNLYSHIRYANFENPIIKIGMDKDKTEEFLAFIQAKIASDRREEGISGGEELPNYERSAGRVSMEPIVLTFNLSYIEWT